MKSALKLVGYILVSLVIFSIIYYISPDFVKSILYSIVRSTIIIPVSLLRLI